MSVTRKLESGWCFKVCSGDEICAEWGGETTQRGLWTLWASQQLESSILGMAGDQSQFQVCFVAAAVHCNLSLAVDRWPFIQTALIEFGDGIHVPTSA